MEKRKLVRESRLLGREFHADAFDVGDEPCVHVVLVGDPDVDLRRYRLAQDTLRDDFTPVLGELEPHLSFAFTWVTAPFDVAFTRAEVDHAAVARWTLHVVEELLPERPDLPLYVAAHSGAAALAFAGLHLHPRCVGAGALGAHELSPHLQPGPAWRGPLTLLYNRDDEEVFEANTTTLEALVLREVAQVVRTPHGGHLLEDYVRGGGLLGLLTRACVAAGWEAPLPEPP